MSEAFECFGAVVDLVDPPALLHPDSSGPIVLLRAAGFPAPARDLVLTVTRGPGTVTFSVDLRVGGLTPRPVLPGVAPALLARYLPAIPPALSRLLASDPPDPTTAPPAIHRQLQDQDTGVLVEAALYRRTRPAQPDTVRLTLALTEDEAAVRHLQALLRLAFGQVRRACDAGGRFLAGRRYVVSRHTDLASDDRVTLADVGGLHDIVAQLSQVARSFNHPEAMRRWGARRPQGILLYGPPGTGKTMLARALAYEIQGTLREIRTPDILDRWLGGSERNIKRIFREARAYQRPTVLLFDEFDSIISYVGDSDGAASQAVNSVAGIFKQEMNNLVEENPNIIVVATTNFPERVDDSLVRSGRFDLKLSVPAPDHAARREILDKAIRRLAAAHETPGFRMFADDLDLDELAGLAPGLTGADLHEVLRRVQFAKAMAEVGGDHPHPIGQDDLRAALPAT